MRMRNGKIALWMVLICFCIFYLVYEAKYISGCDLNLFFDNYVDNAQKYIVNGMLYVLIPLFLLSVDILAPEVRTRFGKDTLWLTTEKTLTDSIVICLFVCSVFITATYIYGFEYKHVDMVRLLNIFTRMFIFDIFCFFLYYDIYMICRKKVWALVTTLFINVLFVVIILACEFQTVTIDSLRVFVIYEIAGSIVFYTLYCKLINTVEIL